MIFHFYPSILLPDLVSRRDRCEVDVGESRGEPNRHEFQYGWFRFVESEGTRSTQLRAAWTVDR